MSETEFKQEDIMPTLVRFYANVRRDPALAPVFEAVIEDWTEHLQRLEDFWSSLILMSGRYKGNPVAMHVIHANQIQPDMFKRWLELWRETTNDMVPADVARAMQAKAGRIAKRLNKALHGPGSTIATQGAAQRDASEPCRHPPILDQTTIPPALLQRNEIKAGT